MGTSTEEQQGESKAKERAIMDGAFIFCALEVARAACKAHADYGHALVSSPWATSCGGRGR